MYQILLTGAVLVTVIVVLRLSRARRSPTAERPDAGGRRSSRVALVGYSFLALLIVGALIVSYLRWTAVNRIVTVEVVDGNSGGRETYQVRRKYIDGRSFRTVDGRRVSLGNGDRMILMPE